MAAATCSVLGRRPSSRPPAVLASFWARGHTHLLESQRFQGPPGSWCMGGAISQGQPGQGPPAVQAGGRCLCVTPGDLLRGTVL